MIYPENDNLNTYPRYVLALLAARRAKMLKEGDKPLVETASDNSLTIALEEIAAGKVRPRLLAPSEVEVEIVEQTTLEMRVGSEESEPNDLELGPDETEAEELAQAPFALAEVANEGFEDNLEDEEILETTLEDLLTGDEEESGGAEEASFPFTIGDEEEEEAEEASFLSDSG